MFHGDERDNLEEYFVDGSISKFVNHGFNSMSNIGHIDEYLCVVGDTRGCRILSETMTDAYLHETAEASSKQCFYQILRRIGDTKLCSRPAAHVAFLIENVTREDAFVRSEGQKKRKRS